MLGEPNLEHLMRFHLKTQQKYGTAPFAFFTYEDKMKTNNIVKTRREILKSILHILIITGLWLQMYYRDKSKVDTVQQLECVCFASAFSAFYLTKRSQFQHSGDVVELYNLFAVFEQSCLKSKQFFRIPCATGSFVLETNNLIFCRFSWRKW